MRVIFDKTHTPGYVNIMSKLTGNGFKQYETGVSLLS